MRSFFIITSLFFLLLTACHISAKKSVTTANLIQASKAEKVLSNAIQAHGGEGYETAEFQFVFREKTYTFKNEDKTFQYIRSFEENGQAVQDILNNTTFKRMINGQEVSLSPKDLAKYRESVNSVIYFATLPHKLQDPAVNLAHEGTTIIKGKSYDVLAVHFDELNGGVDYEDEYYYWINQKTNRIDYLAYNYQVNNGGVRFRSAYNTRVVDGIVFQDYINFKAPLGTPLVELPTLFEKETLQQMSLIETEDVVNLRKAK